MLSFAPFTNGRNSKCGHTKVCTFCTRSNYCALDLGYTAFPQMFSHRIETLCVLHNSRESACVIEYRILSLAGSTRQLFRLRACGPPCLFTSFIRELSAARTVMESFPSKISFLQFLLSLKALKWNEIQTWLHFIYIFTSFHILLKISRRGLFKVETLHTDIHLNISRRGTL